MALVLLTVSAVLVLALLVTLGIALSNTQSDSKAALETRVHERAVLAAALVDSLFATVRQDLPAEERKFGARVVGRGALDRAKGTSVYLALLSPDGSVLASSTGFSGQARSELMRSGALRLVDRGDPYALGNLEPNGRSSVIDFALALSTPHGPRVLVEGFPTAALDTFLDGELTRIPGVAGSHNLIIDGSDTVIASNTSSRPTGYHFASATSRAALGRGSGDRNGRYYDQEPLTGSTWRLVLSAPNGALFASVSGLHRWVPWMIFICFALVATVALALGWRLVHSAERGLARANARLAAVNRELAHSNQQLERRAAELARSNAELDQFASIASHDLQEPLRKVRTFTEQLTAVEGERLSERGADYLRRANRAAERMQGLIQDLLQFSRVTTNPRPFTEVDLGQVAADVLDDLSVEIEQTGAEVSVGELPTISADPLQMRQLIFNLLSNALKFRREGVPPKIDVQGEVAGELARVSVSDNGIGFEPQYNTRIFRVFERLNGRGAYPGTGIGLALCQKIATRHGGEIVATGELGLGAKLTVALPLTHPAEQPAAPEPEPVSEPEPSPLTAPNPDAKEQSHVTT